MVVVNQPGIRMANAADAVAIAVVFSPSLRQLTFLPEVHSEQDDQWFIEFFILRECLVTVAELDSRIVSFLARDGGTIRLLHTHPDWTGNGAASMLVEDAKAAGVAALEIRCFQANDCGRRFFERHGFRAAQVTDGAHNQEKLPDILYRWEQSAEQRNPVTAVRQRTLNELPRPGSRLFSGNQASVAPVSRAKSGG